MLTSLVLVLGWLWGFNFGDFNFKHLYKSPKSGVSVKVVAKSLVSSSHGLKYHLRCWFLFFSSAGSPEWLASTWGSKHSEITHVALELWQGRRANPAGKCSQGQDLLPMGENAKFSLSVFPRLDFLGWKTSSFYFTANISRKWHQSPSETALGHENNIREMFGQRVSYWNKQCPSKYSCIVSTGRLCQARDSCWSGSDPSWYLGLWWTQWESCSFSSQGCSQSTQLVLSPAAEPLFCTGWLKTRGWAASLALRSSTLSPLGLKLLQCLSKQECKIFFPFSQFFPYRPFFMES